MNPSLRSERTHRAPRTDPWRDHSFETDEPCPVCGEPLVPGRGWVIRHTGRWVRLRCGDCVAAYERAPDRYASGLPPA
jgi:hypothetical protein